SATVPFIARYRKEVTGSLDEVQITAVRDRLTQLAELESRKEAILVSLEKHGHLNDELKEKVMAADTMAVLEDIYLPFRPKRRTKATIAREKGLEPLALTLMAQHGIDPLEAAQPFIDAEKGVADADEALEGARHILAETVNEDETARARLRAFFADRAIVYSTVVDGKETEGAKFKAYFNWQQPATTVPTHRMLAMRRGEREEVLSLSIVTPEPEALEILEGLFITG